MFMHCTPGKIALSYVKTGAVQNSVRLFMNNQEFSLGGTSGAHNDTK
jgi:hypothetical protein